MRVDRCVTEFYWWGLWISGTLAGKVPARLVDFLEGVDVELEYKSNFVYYHPEYVLQKDLEEIFWLGKTSPPAALSSV